MTGETPSNEPEQKKEEDKSKFSETLETLKKDERIDSIIEYAKTNTQDTIAYILIVLGVVWIFFNGFYGGLLVGLVSGFYFSKEIMEQVRNVNDTIEKLGVPRSLILDSVTFFL